MFYLKRIKALETKVDGLELALAQQILSRIEKLRVAEKAKYGLTKSGKPRGKPGPRKLYLRPCDLCPKKFHGAVGVAAHKRHVHRD